MCRVVLAVLALAVALVGIWLARATSCPDVSALAARTVVITGCSSGIGAELAQLYASKGANLVIAARRRAELEVTAELARARGAAHGVRVVAVPTDMGKHGEVEALIRAAVSAFGGIDILVLNHAAVDNALLVEYANASSLAEAAASVLSTNVLGAMTASWAALPHLIASRGHIAVVSSASTVAPSPFHSIYVSSKRALHGFFGTLRHELHLLDAPVTIGIQILGMIGTPEVMKDPGNHRLAISVPDCAAAMLCGGQARFREFFVPYWYEPMMYALQLLGPDLSEHVMNAAYIFNVPDYVMRIAAAAGAVNSSRAAHA